MSGLGGTGGEPVDRSSGQARQRGWRRRAGLSACALAAGLMMASCGGSGGSAVSHPTTTGDKQTATSSSAPTTTTDPAATAVLQAYRAGWSAYERALAGAAPGDPALSATMVNPLLQRVRANLLGYQHDGIVGRGAVELYPKVVSVSSVTATVLDCTFSSSELVYANSGKPVPPVTPPEHDGVRATLTLTAGIWKVSQQAVTEGKCAAGS